MLKICVCLTLEIVKQFKMMSLFVISSIAKHDICILHANEQWFLTEIRTLLPFLPSHLCFANNILIVVSMVFRLVSGCTGL